jgi:hypothetical protein
MLQYIDSGISEMTAVVWLRKGMDRRIAQRTVEKNLMESNLQNQNKWLSWYWNASKTEEKAGKKSSKKDYGKKKETGDFSYIDSYQKKAMLGGDE